jgi:hypothetical protein
MRGTRAAGSGLAFAEDDALEQLDLRQELAEMQRLAREIAAPWVSPRAGVELMDEQRRSKELT